MPKAVLHSLASSEETRAPFLVILILSGLGRFPMDLVNGPRPHQHVYSHSHPGGTHALRPIAQAVGRSDPNLSPARWPVDIVLIAKEKGREAFVDHSRIKKILAPAIVATCRLTPETIIFLPSRPSERARNISRMTPRPLRPIPACSATPAPGAPLGPTSPPRGHTSAPTRRVHAFLELINACTIPSRPLRLAELRGGLATELEAFLRSGYLIASYIWADTYPYAHTATSHRLSRLRSKYPRLLPPEAISGWDSRLPMDVRAISR
jgi:hypothetical protein